MFGRADLAASRGRNASSGAVLIQGSGGPDTAKRTSTTTLEAETRAPVSYVPNADAKSPVSSRGRGTRAQTVGDFFRNLLRPSATVVLGASLLLSACATMHPQGAIGQPGVPVAS